MCRSVEKESLVLQPPTDQMRALVIREPWLTKILAGEKTWELRDRNARRRGLIGLIRAGSGQVVGVAHLTDTHGPFTLDELADQHRHHCVPRSEFDPKWKFAWVLRNAVALSRPVSYDHGSGPVTWIVLKPDVEAAIREQLSALTPA